jgi:hypothetical protein
MLYLKVFGVFAIEGHVSRPFMVKAKNLLKHTEFQELYKPQRRPIPYFRLYQ